MRIVDSVRANPGPGAIMAAITQYTVVPAPGSTDEYEHKLLHYAACQALHASPPAAGLSITSTCTAPVAPSVVTHRVKPNGTAVDRPVYALTNGVRGTASIGRALVGLRGCLAGLLAGLRLALLAQGRDLGGEPLDGHRYLFWNFVSSRKERVVQAGRLSRLSGWLGAFELRGFYNGE